jgi:signal transduction histidine kinase/CheY-like chemotaxis protein
MIMMVIELIREFNDIAASSSLVYVLGLMFLLISVVVEAAVSMIRVHSQKIIAVASGERKSEFLSLMSHRIRTPINTISGMAELIERETKSPDIKAYASSIRNAVRMLMSLINDMLDVDRSAKSKVELEVDEYNLAPLLVDCVSLLISRARQDGLDFENKVSKDLPSILYGDSVRIMQIITNVLTNAVKYTNRGTITFVAEKRYIDGKFNLCIIVKDTGIGIKPEDIGEIFNSYNRADEKENRHIEGTGLGLSITKRLVDAMGGQISVESVYGEGSTFTILLPQVVISDEPIGDLEEAIRKYTVNNATYKELFKAPTANVLVVDDNRMNIEVFVGLLKRTEIKIDSAGGGTEAIEKAKKKKYDIIFMDHMMPEPDGIQTLHLLKNDYMALSYATPVVALTANATPGAEKMYLKEGFVSYMSKPVDSEELEKLLLKLLPEEKIERG